MHNELPIYLMIPYLTIMLILYIIEGIAYPFIWVASWIQCEVGG